MPSITLASRLVRKGSLNPAKAGGYKTNLLAAFDGGGSLVVAYPADTPLDTAIASVRHGQSGSLEALRVLLALEARDGNDEARQLLDDYAATITDPYVVYQSHPGARPYYNPLRGDLPKTGGMVDGHQIIMVGTADEAQACVGVITAALPPLSFTDLMEELR